MRCSPTATGLAALFSASVASAGELGPGQSGRVIDDPTFPIFSPISEAPPTGELLDTHSVPFEFTHRPDPDHDDVWLARGTHTTSVFRRPEGGLAFLHVLDETQRNHVNDLESVSLRGFQSFRTDVYALENFTEGAFGVSRSPDGDTINFSFNLETLNGSFLVLTDAADYALIPRAFAVEMDFAINPRFTQSFAAFAPLPEPSTGLLLTSAFATVLRRRR